MFHLSAFTHLTIALASALLATSSVADPLPSWNDTATKSRIIDFVDAVTNKAGQDYVPPDDRIAVFDNDGTLWAEQPVYFQFLYALDTLRDKAKADPTILSSDVLKAAAAGDFASVMAAGEKGVLEVLEVSHAGVSVEAYEASVKAWLGTAKHPQTGMPYLDMTYQPMSELLRYLRDEGFETFIVSGGGIHFMRAFAEGAYGVPPQNVIGSIAETSYSVIDGVPTLMKTPGIAFIDDKADKPVGIDRNIGKRPIFAAGNSDGDFDMLDWTTSGPGPRLGMLVHHTDGVREYAYDRKSPIGQLSKGLDQGPGKGWIIVDMAGDWARIWSGPR